MKKPEIPRQIVRTPVVTQIGRFITASCTAVAVCFALSSEAVNILTNPGFDGPPAGFTGWSAQSYRNLELRCSPGSVSQSGERFMDARLVMVMTPGLLRP